MAPRRYIPPETVAKWEKELRAAVDAALAEMHAHVTSDLARHGHKQPKSLVAAGRRKKAIGVGVGAALTLWKTAQWAAAVATYIAPVAAAVAAEAVATAQAAVPSGATWGMPSPATGIAQSLVAPVTASGAYLGSRLNQDAAAASDPGQVVDDVFDTAGDIIGGQLGRDAEAASNAATNGVASYASDYLGSSVNATKTWQAVGDDRTREDHLDADGQEVDINDPFTVGGEQLDYPGDPAGSAEQTENCRCWIVTDGIDPDIAIYGEDQDQDPAEAGLETILNRAGRQTPLPTSPRSYPN